MVPCRDYQFALIESTSFLSNILLSEVNLPHAIAFHPVTSLHYNTEKPAEQMSTQDWLDFLTGISTGRIQVCVTHGTPTVDTHGTPISNWTLSS